MLLQTPVLSSLKQLYPVSKPPMELQPHEEVRINNFKAHYNSIASELAVAVARLTETVEQKKTLESQITELEASIASKQSDLAIIEERCEHLTWERADLDRRTQSLATAKTEFEAFKESEIAALKAEKLRLESSIAVKTASLTAISIEEAALRDQITALNSEVEGLKSDVALLKKDKQELELAHSGEVTARNKQLAALDKDIADKQEELSRVNALVEAEKAKIEKPLESLKEREQQLDVRESSFRIMAGRMKDRFSQMYPGRTLKI